MREFEPRIAGFICNWCAYQGADLAGTSRIHHLPNIIPVRFMCSGQIDPVLALKALISFKVDAVLVSGCHPGDCHYIHGNFYARRRFLVLRKLLEFVGLEPERLQMSWVSAAEGKKWADVSNKVIEQIKQLGPSPLKEL